MDNYLALLTSACLLVTLSYIALKIKTKMIIDEYETAAAPLLTGLASIMMMLIPLPPELNHIDLRFAPIVMAGLRYGTRTALLSALLPILYTSQIDDLWLIRSLDGLLLPALISGFFHNHEYRSGYTKIRMFDIGKISMLLFVIHVAFASAITSTFSFQMVPGHLFTLLVTTIALSIVTLMFNDENTNWMLQRKLELQANQDGLTQLPNIRSFTTIADDMMAHRRVALFLIDLDNFKQYNDHYGHLAGDDLLRQISKLLRNTIANRDLLARYGGEEFILLSLETDENQLAGYAEKLCRTVEDSFANETLNSGSKWPVTISIGISISNGPHDNLHRIIKQSDQALYQSKHDGKNRYTIYQSASSPASA